MGASVSALAMPAYSTPLKQKMASGRCTAKERVQPMISPPICKYY